MFALNFTVKYLSMRGQKFEHIIIGLCKQALAILFVLTLSVLFTYSKPELA